ncbi:hypothetical protein [Alteribacillus bidgolensis]|uniref:Uncharacterized protein n=1 Tax=Alteribacillus bidgolensis TaxID=930129 RepID=A0A1G8RIT0_9BACI|nr:hypothetical protein [Alteribacillus bidgolensis]SDJ16984.1 hypothetical protein SAMN05216352_12811 [Alteribacillus bidgolensis]
METIKNISNALNLSKPSLKKCVFGGFMAGIVAAILANIGNLLLGSLTGQSYPQLNLMSITLSSLVTNLIGSMVYFGFTRHTKHPFMNYSVLALVVATLDSVFVAVNPPVPGFSNIANPLHYVVAVTSILLIPYVARGKKD